MTLSFFELSSFLLLSSRYADTLATHLFPLPPRMCIHQPSCSVPKAARMNEAAIQMGCALCCVTSDSPVSLCKTSFTSTGVACSSV
ncbi:hypothetical protein C8R45DRAFT_1016244 [Mycena sanguinolenta]|nr:hypothetical protein C8R45DRAFT_1016244 [Mycena sanguinolenta]